MKKLFIAALAWTCCAAALAQDYPAKPIRLIIPYAAGSVAEVLFRTLAPVMEPKLGQRFIVDARPGANGNIGMAEAARAVPDGYTLVLAPTANFAVLDHLAKNLPFNALTSFDPISMIGAAFSQLNGNTMVHIPYKGTPPMIVAMLGGDIQVTFASMTAVLPQLKAGKLRALAVMGRQRQPELPDLPTTVEAGFAQLVMSNWWVVAGPKGTPSRAVDRMAAELRAALADPGVRKRYADVGHIPTGRAPAETAAFLRSESARYKGIVEAGNIRLEN